MSQAQPRPAAPNPKRNVKAIRTVRFWMAPIATTLALMSALAALYLGGILNPMTNLRHFPIALVNEDAGPAGQQIVDGLVSGLDKNKFDIRVVSPDEARRLLDTAAVYGSALIPPTFSSQLRDFGASAVTPTRTDRPAITISTNPRAGTLAASIAGQTLTRALTVVNGKVGERLTAEVAAQTGGVALAGAAAAGLASPIDVKSTAYNPLPNGTGNGLSAFYYALLLLLAGFTGSIVVSTLVDSMLGYVPAEFGPVYRFAEQVNISRFRTLLVKWAVMVVLALLTSGVYLAIAHGLGMPIPLGWQVWLYGVFAIIAVGVTSSSLIAVLGSMGLLVKHVDLRHPRIAVGGRDRPAGSRTSVLPLVGSIRADAPGVPRCAVTAVSERKRRRRPVPGPDHDVDRADHRAVAGWIHHTPVRPQQLPPNSGSGRDGDRRGTPSSIPSSPKRTRKLKRTTVIRTRPNRHAAVTEVDSVISVPNAGMVACGFGPRGLLC
ncbi:transmembrane protein [Mycobacterium tuberculosis]|nr:transmembrane protein [Mycobacterium tuberculosis]CMG90786.1 transmembrane protein [Mycobacterium tuberculosis]